jgi:glycerate kinase
MGHCKETSGAAGGLGRALVNFADRDAPSINTAGQ